MSIKNFFKKIGRGIKKAAGKVWGGVKKAAGFVGKVTKPILNVMSVLPGTLGLIGKVGSAAANVVKDVVDRIPNQQAKDKLNEVIDKGKQAVDNVQEKAQTVANKVKPWADAGLSFYNKPIALPPIPGLKPPGSAPPVPAAKNNM